MKKFFYKTAILLLCVFQLCLVTACAQEQGEKAAPRGSSLFGPGQQELADIVYFSFLDFDGWQYPAIYTLERNEAGEYLASYRKSEQIDWQIPTGREEVLALIRQYGIAAWDGYDESIGGNDFPGFSLEIRFADGTEINARGDGMFPDGFAEARESIIGMFERIYERHHANRGNSSVWANMPDFQKLPLYQLSLTEFYSVDEYREYTLYVSRETGVQVHGRRAGDFSMEHQAVPAEQAETARALLEEHEIYTWTERWTSVEMMRFRITAIYADGSRVSLTICDPVPEEYADGLNALQVCFAALTIGMEMDWKADD